MSSIERSSVDTRRRRGARFVVRAGAVTALVAGSMLTGAGTAGAATTVTFDPNLGLLVTARPGVANNLTIKPSGLGILISDSADTVTSTAYCPAVDAHSIRCSADSLVLGLTVNAADGNDRVVIGAAGWISVFGGSGDDTLLSVDGAKQVGLYGGDGRDSLLGGPASDTMEGGLGADSLSGGGGIDTVRYSGRTGSVRADLDGVANDGEVGEGDLVALDVENLEGGSGNDILKGGAGVNRLGGSYGHDVIYGLAGNDTLEGGQGDDILLGGDGNDVVREVNWAYSDGNDTFGGGTGTDTASFAAYGRSVTADLDGVADDGRPSFGEADNYLADVENFEGGLAGDTLTGNASANVMSGGGGGDVLRGAGGNDRINGGTGSDALLGEAGDDVLQGSDGSLGNDRLDGGLNTDTCIADLFDFRSGCEA